MDTDPLVTGQLFPVTDEQPEKPNDNGKDSEEGSKGQDKEG